MISEKKKSEEKAVKRIITAITAIIFIYAAICTISFVAGKYDEYSTAIEAYKNEAKGKGEFTNIEQLQFLNTEDVIEYKKNVAQILEAEPDIKGYDNITVLDVITYNQDTNTYEWLIALDDKDKSTFSNSFNGKEHTFSIYQFTQSEKENSEDSEDMNAEASDEYVAGGIQNIADTTPTIENINILNEYIGDISSTSRAMFAEKLRVFLVDTENNRRIFKVRADSIKETSNGFSCLLDPKIKLENDNIIKVNYDKESDTYEYEYFENE